MLNRLLFYGFTAIIMLIAVSVDCAEPNNAKVRHSAESKGGKQLKQAKKDNGRVALVIGNGRYATSALKVPVKSAHALSATLRRIGFVVEEKNDLNRVAMKKALAAFKQRLNGGAVGVFYFSGYGIQVQGKNFLVPVDAKISSEQDVLSMAVAVDQVLELMKGANAAVNIVILDASRDNQIERSFRAVSSGLASMDAPAGAIIATSTATGMTTVDNSDESVGIYAKALISAFDTPGLTLSDLFQQVRRQVADKTANHQIPWEFASIGNNFTLVPPFDPSGGRLTIFKEATPYGEANTTASSRRFTDSLTGMEFLPVSGGCFQMGDVFGNGLFWEQPVHVACVKDFYISKYEVTQAQWLGVMGNNPSSHTGCDDCPVEMVSWDDVQIFIRKLNQEASRMYRLPTEAEWEYAARSGGKEEMFSGGSDVDAVAWYHQNSGGMSHKVGTRQPNGLGVHDMSGNVWEWVQDRYGSYNNHRQNNPIGPPSGLFRVFRGGCWAHETTHSRTSIRYYSSPGGRMDFLGFRLAVSRSR